MSTLKIEDALVALKNCRNAAEKALRDAKTPQEVLEVNRAYLGKEGYLTMAMSTLKDLAPTDRPRYGNALTSMRDEVSKAVKKALAETR